MTAAGVDWMRWMEEFRLGTPIVHVNCDYLAPISLHDRIGIDLLFENVTAKGFEVRFVMWKTDGGRRRRVAEGSIRRRFVNLNDFRAAQAPPEVVEIFYALAAK